MTRKFIIILIIGVVTIVASSFAIAKNISNINDKSKCCYFSKCIRGKNEVRNNEKLLWKYRSLKKLIEAKEILSSYGYDEDISLSGDEVALSILKTMLIIFIPIIILLFNTFISIINKRT